MAARIADRAYIYDNSVDNAPAQLLFRTSEGALIKRYGESEAVVNGVGTFVVESERDRDLRRELARAVVGRQWGLLELRPVALTLEDIFIRIVTEEETTAGAAPADEEGDSR